MRLKTLRKSYIGKIALIFCVCAILLSGLALNSLPKPVRAVSPKVQDSTLVLTLTPNYDTGVFTATLTPTTTRNASNCYINIFAVPGRKAINQIQVTDYAPENLPSPAIKIVDAHLSAQQFFADGKAVTYTFNSNVFVNGQEYTIFAYYQFEDAECTHYFSNLIYYTHLVPIPLPPDPVKEGHTFVGWYYDAEFLIPYDGAPIYADTVLYAKFVPNVYTISFDTLGGNTLEPIQAEYNTTITLPTPNRLGHRFLGWYTDAELTTPFAENTPIKSNMTLYAKWELQTVTVTFVVDGNVYTTLEIPYGAVLKTNTTAAQYLAAMGKLYTDSEKKISLT